MSAGTPPVQVGRPMQECYPAMVRCVVIEHPFSAGLHSVVCMLATNEDVLAFMLQGCCGSCCIGCLLTASTTWHPHRRCPSVAPTNVTDERPQHRPKWPGSPIPPSKDPSVEPCHLAAHTDGQCIICCRTRTARRLRGPAGMQCPTSSCTAPRAGAVPRSPLTGTGSCQPGLWQPAVLVLVP